MAMIKPDSGGEKEHPTVRKAIILKKIERTYIKYF